MLAGELERKNVVIEVSIEAIHTIMTIQAYGTEGQSMRSHESQVHLTMTGISGLRRERGYIDLMAIVTLERFRRSRLLVTV